MSTKVIVCRCEDVTLGDVQAAFALGYLTVEEVKRYTGLGTGPCQGQECMVHCALLCLQASARPPSEIGPFTARPPFGVAPLGLFARGDEEEP
jgi:sarcosine oxidase subunit beta